MAAITIPTVTVTMERIALQIRMTPRWKGMGIRTTIAKTSSQQMGLFRKMTMTKVVGCQH